MAKPRRHATDRLLGTGRSAGHGTGTDLPDLAEDEVIWSSAYGGGGGGGGEGEGDDWGWRRSELIRSHPWVDRRGGGLSLALEDGCAPRRAAAGASAPMEVPVWPSFLRDESASSLGLFGREEEEEGVWVPPHEYLAREKGRSVATSVLEGAGRTLKGRDMSRVRDAVWSRTGFFG